LLNKLKWINYSCAMKIDSHGKDNSFRRIKSNII